MNNNHIAPGTQKEREHVVIGILAHVDAGKTTLSEALLYLGGSIRKMGRVDTKDAFLDTDETERARGITIYSKMAQFRSRPPYARLYTLLDTPGHSDFGAETERAIPMLDAAVLLISAADGVNVQVRQLFDLLRVYRVPVLIFVNKMDQISRADDEEEHRKALLSEIREKLTENAVDFTDGAGDEQVQEQIAFCADDEALLERVMEGTAVTDGEIGKMVSERTLFPVLFGSALKMQGVEPLMEALDRFVTVPSYPAEFAARVYKIVRDASGERETWLKITGGSLAVRQQLNYQKAETEGTPDPEQEEETPADTAVSEKINQIRVYNGERYETLREADAGTVCAVTGLTGTYAGQGLGAQSGNVQGLLEAPLMWEILLPQNVDPFRAFRLLKPLEEEEPMLRLSYDERRRVIRARLMGQVQREIIRERVRKRCGFDISFGRPSVVYKETIASAVEGVGHFEPLRHYAEVHLLLEPGEPGSGIILESRCSTDVLARQYQNVVLSQLARRRHRGVLTGSELTDVKITLLGGRAHINHTEGGDFRQAAFRAVRQGLMMAENVLLEPYYDFEMTLPQDTLGRALKDLTEMNASFRQPETDGTSAVITGSAPVTAIDAYQEELTAYTKGEGVLKLRQGTYRPCAQAQKVVEETGYDPDADKGQPSASVFCSHGAGMLVPWYEVRDYMHLDTGWRPGNGRTETEASELREYAGNGVSRAGAARENDGSAARVTEQAGRAAVLSGASQGGWDSYGRHIGKTDDQSFKDRESRRFAAEEELMAIFEKTYGPVKRNLPQEEKTRERIYGDRTPRPGKPRPRPEKEYLLVDGYNMIFAWETLRELAQKDIKAARDLLIDILADYAGYASFSVICVFDAYKVAEGRERVLRYQTIDVVFTKEAETADQYIEKTAHELKKRYGVTVATSDAVEQIIIFSAGARRMSAADLLYEISESRKAVREKIAQEIQVRDGRLHTSLADKVEAAVKHSK